MAQPMVIIGAGLAGHHAALALAEEPEATRPEIILLGAEPGLPYDRPPLSKDLLLGKADAAAIMLQGADRYAERGIVYRSETGVIAIDRASATVLVQDGTRIAYHRLLLATGSRPRALPATWATDAVTELRTRADAVALHAQLVAGRHLVVIGGGFIGLEVAAAARAKGLRVTVLEAADRLLVRGMPPLLGHWAAALHTANGVALQLGARVLEVSREASGIAVTLDDGVLHADLVVAGIGVVPNIELAAQAGLVVTDGIVVDEACRTSDPAIFAAGEVTARPRRVGTGLIRVESWKSSQDQAVVAARGMAGQAASWLELPWLWSDQFDANIQSLGFPAEAAGFLLRGDQNSSKWCLIGLDAQDMPIGAVAVNSGREIANLRRVMTNGAALPAALREGAVKLAEPA